jgi:hypothetical protein
MKTEIYLDKIKEKFGKLNDIKKIPLKRTGYFRAKMMDDGIWVSNLRTKPFLVWGVFYETIELLKEKGCEAIKGNAMNYKLGQQGLSLDSVEGRIAYKIYGKKEGQSVFRRVAPTSSILSWAGICEDKKGTIKLIK